MISRRTFMHQSGVLAAAALVTPSPQSRRYKMGLQLFTLRAAMAAGRPRHADAHRRHRLRGGRDLRLRRRRPRLLRDGRQGLQALLADNNLTTSSGHYDLNKFVATPIDDLTRYVDRCIEGAHALGQAYITWPWLDEQSRTIETFKVVAERLNVIGAQIRKAGLQLAYHNHDFEFVEQQGQIGYDIITARDRSGSGQVADRPVLDRPGLGADPAPVVRRSSPAAS